MTSVWFFNDLKIKRSWYRSSYSWLRMKGKNTHPLQNEWVINEYMITKSVRQCVFWLCSKILLFCIFRQSTMDAIGRFCLLTQSKAFGKLIVISRSHLKCFTWILRTFRLLLLEAKEWLVTQCSRSMCLLLWWHDARGILPEWEDPHNANGGRIFFKKSLDAHCVDVTWENLLIGLVGEMMDDENQYINGIRITDKGTSQRAMYKIELWIRTDDRNVVNQLKPGISRCICENNELVLIGIPESQERWSWSLKDFRARRRLAVMIIGGSMMIMMLDW